MAVGVTPKDPITAMRAVIRIESAELADSKFKDSQDRAQKQFACELMVMSGAGDRDGELFLEWFSFPADGNVGPRTKTGQVLDAALRGDATAETLEELADKLQGKTFAAQIGTSRDGAHSRVVHDTIGAVQAGDAPSKTARDVESSVEDDDPKWERIPF